MINHRAMIAHKSKVIYKLEVLTRFAAAIIGVSGRYIFFSAPEQVELRETRHHRMTITGYVRDIAISDNVVDLNNSLFSQIRCPRLPFYCNF